MTTHPQASRSILCLLLASGMLATISGCASPLEGKADRDLRRMVRESAQRELRDAELSPEPQKLSRESRVDSLQIAPEVMKQLDAMGGPGAYVGTPLPLGSNLFGERQKVVRVTLERVIGSTVKNNLNVQFARLAPAISQNQLVAAEAAFDWVLFANTQYARTNQPRVASAIGGGGFGTDENRSDNANVEAGLRKPLISGGQLTVQSQLGWTENRTNNLVARPDPSVDTNVVVQLDQPLLRNFGSDVALSQVRLARNAELDNIQQLKGTLLTNINDAEQAYWNLVRAQSDLLIIERLLARGEEVLKILRDRRGFDAKPANLSNAAAAVESRRADLIRAQRTLRDASDRLKTLMNDPALPVGSETMVLPADPPVDQAVEFSLVDVLNTALVQRPEVQRAVISIDNTSIRQQVADNGRLPRLDLRALSRLNGLGGDTGRSYRALGDADFVDYQISLAFEQPLGNRAAEATFRQRRLERMQAVLAYQNTVQGIVQELKNALRAVTTNYVLIEQTRAARVAATEDLRTLLVEEQTIQGLTPEFLNLKLSRQQALAAAEQQEISALADYNSALAQLYTSMGTSLERNRVQFMAPPVRVEPRSTDLFPDYPLEPARPPIESIRKQ